MRLRSFLELSPIARSPRVFLVLRPRAPAAVRLERLRSHSIAWRDCGGRCGGIRKTRNQTSRSSAGTDISFGINSQHFVLGYFHRVPPGPILFTYSQVLCGRRWVEGWAKVP